MVLFPGCGYTFILASFYGCLIPRGEKTCQKLILLMTSIFMVFFFENDIECFNFWFGPLYATFTKLWWAGGNALNLSAVDSYSVCHLVCKFKCDAQELKQFFIVCNSQFLTVLKTKQLMHREKDPSHFHPFLH